MAKKSMAARDKADKAADKKKGIKQGSPADIKADKKAGVFNFEYGNKKAKGKSLATKKKNPAGE